MARASRERAEFNHRAIADAASRLFRERGFKGVSVADLMGAAGLTHGGFYAHFDSKESLTAEAVARAFDESVDGLQKTAPAGSGQASAIEALLSVFLTRESRDYPGSACPSSTLATDVARERRGSPLQDAYVKGIERMVGALSAAQTFGPTSESRSQALGDMSTMVGGLVLARATGGSPLSDELLLAARDRLSASAASADPRGPGRKLT